MNTTPIFSKNRVVPAFLVLALLLCGCGKSAPDATKDASPAKPVAQASPSDQSTSAVAMDLSVAAVRILNAAHRNGAVVLKGECGASISGGANGIRDQFSLHAPVTLEPMDKALQEVSAGFQNIYWRESPASGVRVADSAAKAGLLRVKIKVFRVVEDLEPDGVMAVVWRTKEVTAFLRRNHVRLARRVSTAKKVLSPPMILEMKNATVADILDRIAANYRADPPKVWIYRECADKKETLVDVEMK
jgi:hypothetical protein